MTKSLLTLVHELQALETLNEFLLAGGTNLAVRFNHRKSIDIDLFTHRLIGISGYITDQIALDSLLQSLKEKKTIYSGASYQCLFDLDHEKDPLNDSKALLMFDTGKSKDPLPVITTRTIGWISWKTASRGW